MAYCLTASALAFGFRPLAYRLVLTMGLALLAGSMEIFQRWVPGRHPAITDAIVSCFGGLLGVALWGFLFDLATEPISIAATSANCPARCNNLMLLHAALKGSARRQHRCALY